MYRLIAFAALLTLAQACCAQGADVPLVRTPGDLAALAPDTQAIEFYADDAAEHYSFEHLPNLASVSTDEQSLVHLADLRTVKHLEIWGLEHPNVALAHLGQWTNLESLRLDGGADTLRRGLRHLKANTKLKRFTTTQSLTQQSARDLGLFERLEYIAANFSRFAGLGTARELLGLPNSKRFAHVELHFRDTVEPEVVRLLAKLPGLAVLDLRWTTPIDDFTEPLRGHEGVREIDFYNHRLTYRMMQNLASCPNLERLHLTCCKGLGDTGLLEFKDHASLQVLDLSYVNGVTPRALKRLRCSKLQNLNLVGCSGVDADSMASVARLPALRELSVGGSESFDDTSMALVARMNHLTSLRLHNAVALTVEGWTELLRMTWLENLNVERCEVPADVLVLLTALTRLRTLNLRGSANMSDDLFLRLTELPMLRYIACDTDRLGEDAQIEVHKRHPALSQVVRPPRNTPYQARWMKTQRKLAELFPEQIRRERLDDSEYWWQD